MTKQEENLKCIEIAKEESRKMMEEYNKKCSIPKNLKISEYTKEIIWNSTRSFPEGHEECCHCGRPVNPETCYYVQLSDDSSELLHEDSEEGNMGWAPIGTTCSKKIPKGYKVK